MSRSAKKKREAAAGRQKPTNPPAAPAAKPRRSDDALTDLAETMRPAHRRFAEGVIAGRTAAKAATDAGFSPTSARSIGYRLLRRADVRRYIHLAQREEAVAARVTAAALIDRLWRTVTDANASKKEREAATAHLVRMFMARRTAGGPGVEDGDGRGLTDQKAAEIEAGILGVRR